MTYLDLLGVGGVTFGTIEYIACIDGGGEGNGDKIRIGGGGERFH